MSQVAVVILNWNGAHLLEQYLPSVIEHSGDARIIVADNASTDKSIPFLKENYPQVEIIQNQTNGGFAKGYNDALGQVKADYYVLLNSDVKVTEGWLDPLVEMMNEKDVAACQPKVRALREPEKLEHAGACGGFLDKNYFPFCRGRVFMHVEEDKGQYDYPCEIFWATGAAMMIRSEAYHEVGGLDNDFFAHMEEIDLCWRLKQKGYRIMAEPKSVIYHLGGATLDYSSPRKVYLNFRNSLMMIIKNHEGLLFPKMFNRMCLDGIAGIRFLIRGQFRSFFAVLRAHFFQYRHYSTLRQKRKEIRAERKVTNYKGLYTGSIVWDSYIKGVNKFSQLNQRLFK